jgi:hypothetical protein
MTLTRLERLSLVYSLLTKTFGPTAHRFVGPACWYTNPQSSLPQIIKVCPDPLDRDTVSLVAHILGVAPTREMVNEPRVWALEKNLERGLLEPDVLAFGVGEGLGMARSVGYELTDIDALKLHDAIRPLYSKDADPNAVREAWVSAIPNMAGYASWHLLSFLYSPYMGADKTMTMIDCRQITKESFERLEKVDPFAKGLTVQKTIDILMGR